MHLKSRNCIINIHDSFPEKQKRPEQFRLRVHQGGAGLNSSQPRGCPHHQPAGIRWLLLLQSGLRKTQHGLFKGHLQALNTFHSHS